jgi:hypothetical protein
MTRYILVRLFFYSCSFGYNSNIVLNAVIVSSFIGNTQIINQMQTFEADLNQLIEKLKEN